VKVTIEPERAADPADADGHVIACRGEVRFVATERAA